MEDPMATHTEPALTPLARSVLERRYLARDQQGGIIETPARLFHRVARAVAEADRLFDPGRSIHDLADRFESAMSSLSFLPNTPCLIHAGRPMGQLAACFVLPVEDNLESIFQTLKDTALIHQTGGGTGFSFSRIRPRGDTLFPAQGVSSGPVSFIQLFDSATDLIDRNQIRPGANMGVLRADHPDIEEFIRIKTHPHELQNFNLSVAVDETFMECLKSGRDYPLLHPRTGTVMRRVSAGALLEMMADCAWQSGDPGLLFIDRINRGNPTPGLGAIEATNPCGEQPLLAYESCTLGSINITKFVENNEINYERLNEQVKMAVHFLDNVVEINRYPLARIDEWSRTTRKIGLGVMGFADALIMMGIPYQSEKALQMAEEVMAAVQAFAVEASEKLAEERGNFPAFHHSRYPSAGVKNRRNAVLTTIAPTGSISLIAGVSSGIEPVFAFRTRRRLINTMVEDVHPLYQQYLDAGKPVSEDVFQTAWDISPDWHLKIQAAFQNYTDNAVSKTVNFPSDATVADIRHLFETAMDTPVKGVTVYRDQSREDQTLSAYPEACTRCG
jgi:ribonucleoside-diphosphate reductase alpha chain